MAEHTTQTGLSPEEASPETPVQSIPEYLETLVTRARQAANRLAILPTAVKNQALIAMADALEAQTELLLAANDEDMKAFSAAPEK
jgi:glutamate-5-semialdehyde dehydrogenase